MAFNKIAWATRVSDAAASGDGAALARLFAEGQVGLGDHLGADWAAALSAWDAGAVTG